MGRYDTSGLIEDMYAPGSQNLVLKNKRGITDKQIMDEAETRAYLSVMNRTIDMYDRDHRFNGNDLCDMHRLWLSDIYAWAGLYRTVNISKGDFTFAMARQIPVLMESLEKDVLAELTPCIFENIDDVVHAVSVVHVELVLIHPFREGNGRLARLLSVLMGLQAGLPPFDFSCMVGKNREMYFAAVQAGMARNYNPMKVLFKNVISISLDQERD